MALSASAGNRDSEFMQLALNLAAKGLGSVEPNPMVGCVLVRDGKLIGQGYHQQYGQAHAEINALRQCSDASGATAYVTLEPCCHFGKTPPCSRALIDAGICRVVIAMVDPFAKVAGGGLAELNAAGIETVTGVLQQQARELNAAYLKRVTTGRPWCIAKWAMTVDGRIATSSGQSQWITGQAARADVHQTRARLDAILVGMGTVSADDPMLTARLNSAQQASFRTATRVVFCTRRLPAIASRLVQSASEFPLLLMVGPAITDQAVAALIEHGATMHRCQATDPVAMIPEAMDCLGAMGMTNVLVEGGSELMASFVHSGQIDQCDVYVGPLVFGGRGAPGPIGGDGVQQLSQAARLKLVSATRLGEDDVKLVYRYRMSDVTPPAAQR